METGNIVILKGRSKHGKDRVAQHGNPWTIQAQGVFNGNKAVRMISDGETYNLGRGRFTQDQRWVFLKDDPNFWVECDEDAMQRICDANIPTDWLTI